MLTFNESQLLQDLAKMNRLLRGAFAAACAERLLPAYLIYAERYKTGNANTLRSALDGVWEMACEGKPMRNPEKVFADCIALAPSDAEYENEGVEGAECAVAAIACAVSTATSDDGPQALVSATRSYEALDAYVSHELDIDFSQPGSEAVVLCHPIVQAELERQQRDLRDLATATGGTDAFDVARRIRARSIQEASIFFGQRIGNRG